MAKKPDLSEGPDLARRALLRRIGLAGTMAYTAPALTALGMARASGGDGGGDGGGGSGGGGSGGASGGASGGSSGASGASGPSGRAGPSGAESGADGGDGDGDGGGRSATARQQAQARRTLPPPSEILLSLPAGQGTAAIEALGYRVLSSTRNTTLDRQLLRLALPPGRTPDQARAELSRLSPNVTADANHFYRTDEFLCTDGSCAAQDMIGWTGWPSAFAPKIGMIDTGINVAHEALAGQKLTVFQTERAERNASGRQHGTAIAALLVGRLDSRVPGLLPHAELIAVEAFHRDGSGDLADAFSLAAAVDLLVAQGVSVINMSFSGPENAVLREVTERAAAQSIALVAAAGNGGAGAKPAYPAAWPHVIAVTAVDSRQRIYRQANQGPYITLAAPGVGVWTAASISGGRLKSGTSYAAPFVTAALAVQRLRQPDAPLAGTLAHMIDCAQDLGEAGFDPVYGNGLISAPGICKGKAGEIFSVSGE
ncbi:MAG: S8 family serine peptidase [Rhodobacterales bacterium]|nr:S8 family serine peptidase [Rhodobacterales bacterium]